MPGLGGTLQTAAEKSGKNKRTMSNIIRIFDTTLRDGEQSPGASLSVYEKVEIARQLEKLGVDVIEAGFPVSSPHQFEAVQRVSAEVSVMVAALARAKEQDIKTAWEALSGAEKPCIHTFSSTSDYHIMGKFADERYGGSLAEKRKTIVKMSEDAVQYAKTLCDFVEFSAEDAGRTDLVYLAEVIEAAISAGADVVNIPDTTGYTVPSEFAAKIRYLMEHVPNIHQAVVSVHCHNDLGLAVANSLAAIESGARQVECTVNGLGERAGNAALEEIVMALKVRKDLLRFDTRIRTREIYNSSRMVSGYTGIIVQPNKAIVGENAFAHESGIHQDGMLKNRETYEIMTPEMVGVKRTKIVLGRHSGRHGLKARMTSLGYKLQKSELDRLYERFTELADKKKEIFDDDLLMLMGDQAETDNSRIHLHNIQFNSGSNLIPTAMVQVKINGDLRTESATGDGPVDAIFNAIDRALGTQFKLESYQVRSVTAGREAMGEVFVRIRDYKQSYTGHGVSTDIIEASAKAYLHAVNSVRENSEMWNEKASV